MKRKEIVKLGIVYVMVFFISVYMDINSGELTKDGTIYRNEVGEDSKDVDLILNIEDVFQDYEVSLEVEPRHITQEEAERYFATAIDEIENDFKKMKDELPVKKSYQSGILEAQWTFSPVGIVGTDGEINEEKVPKEGVIMTANVILSCDAYQKIYTFPFHLEKPELSIQEKIEKELFVWLEKQQQVEGEMVFLLPKELAGLSVNWNEKKEYLSIKILILEICSIFLLVYGKKKEKENEEKKRRLQRERQYPEIINQLLILLEAGMTTRQAWHRMAILYNEKRKKNLIAESEVYGAVLQLDRRLSEGEKEKMAYEVFVKQMDVMCYRRMMRLLINNLEKGNKDICQQLSIEAKQAYDERILLAKKLGEEASTKMLIPMMLMMVLVMVIVMAPAIMSFSI